MEEPNLNYLPDELRQTMEKWARITIKELRQSMVNKYIGQTGALYKSFEYKLQTDGNGMPTKITIGFWYHGRFVDMGVGNGIKLENVKSNREVWANMSRADRKGKTPRKAKKWYSPVIYHEYQRAVEILRGKYAIELPARFENILSIKDTLQN
jgi:hypothetical protein